MKIGLLTGTFDPPTLGHINIIERAAKLLGKLLIGVAVSPSNLSFGFKKLNRQEISKKIKQKDLLIW